MTMPKAAEVREEFVQYFFGSNEVYGAKQAALINDFLMPLIVAIYQRHPVKRICKN